MSTVRLLLQECQPPTALKVHYQTFRLDCEAQRCTSRTLTHYVYTARRFVTSLRERAVESIEDIGAKQIRACLVGLPRCGLEDARQYAHGWDVKTWFNWLVTEAVSPDAAWKGYWYGW